MSTKLASLVMPASPWRQTILRWTIPEDMPLSKPNPKRPKTKITAGKRWKAAPSKPSAATAKASSKVSQRVKKIIDLLESEYADAKCSLLHESPFQLLIATMLSAQCTDERVNKVTPNLFSKFPTPTDLAAAKEAEVEEIIRSTGFFRNKAKKAIECAKVLLQKHRGEVPRTMEELSVLPGVGRKTANVVLGNAFGIPGLVVDTHVFRLSHRLGLVKGKNPVEVEKELELLIPREFWTQWAHWLIYHGRAICIARKPKCDDCLLQRNCQGARDNFQSTPRKYIAAV